jgi:late competence protein required for DNA uptake (superfamily II DNA/RNA helicase)
MTMAARVAPAGATCPNQPHRHQLTCSRCGTTDGTVAQTIVRNGVPWPPTCQECARTIRAKSDQMLRKQEAAR